MAQTSSAVSILQARPEHASFIAWVLLTAGRSHLEKGVWDFLAGPDEAHTLHFLEAMVSTADPHWAHCSIFLVAEIGGRPASALCGYFDEEHPTGAPGAVLAAAKAVERAPEGIMAAWQESGGASIMLCSPEHVPGAWIVEHVATRPEFRRQGLVDRLLASALEKGRTLGATVADIGVLIGNDGAQRAYEKAGFRVTGEKVHPDFQAVYGCPGIRLLSRPL